MENIARILSESGIAYIALLMALTVHEFGHAYAADRLGDPLPRLDGRVSLNPLVHIDMLGTVILPLLMIISSVSYGGGFMIFGWAKPVRVSLPNPQHRVRDDIISTLAGPFMNLVFAVVCLLITVALYAAGLKNYVGLPAIIMEINIVLFVFNMLPVPPLDGSRILKHAVGMGELAYARLSSYGFIIVLLMINFAPIRRFISFLIGSIMSALYFLGDLILNAIN